MADASCHEAIEAVFKSTYPKLFAVLLRLFGTNAADAIEDLIQDTFQAALVTWPESGIPIKPEAWLISVAKNKAINLVRQRKNHQSLASDIEHLLKSNWSLSGTVDAEFSDDHIRDDMLRMIFLCCRDEVSPNNRLPFILRALCGFSIHAIGRALILPEATVKKRLLRTRRQLANFSFDLPSPEILSASLDSVHTILYLLFNEGYYSSSDKEAINLVMCYDALGLVSLLCDHERLVNRDTLSLLALMKFLFSRRKTRLNETGLPVPLDLQNRALWDENLIHTAETILRRSMDFEPGVSGRFFLGSCYCSGALHSKAL